MEIRKSVAKDHVELTDLCKRSKNIWNYPEDWMQIWDEDLTVTEDFIKENNVYQFVKDARICGFYSYLPEGKNIRLEHLFVHPNYINKGIGRILIKDFFERIENSIFENIILDADPNAENFYIKFGFNRVDLKPTKIEGRCLPVMIKSK